MNAPTLTGEDAPVVTLDGSTLTLHYASLAAYSARIHADHAAVEAIARITSSCVDDVPIYGLGAGSGSMRVTYSLAPLEAPAASAAKPAKR